MPNRKRRDNSLPLILMALGGLVVLVIGGWLAWKLVQPSDAPEPTAEQAVNAQDAPRVTLEEAKIAYDKQNAVFVDVRDANSYASDHIPGALSIPLSELPDRLGELDANTWIITYCT
jgi:3-mercaptopyruvate sulfurtransferase SseA